MEDEVKKVKGQLVEALKNYFNNDLERVKQFGNEMKSLGFDFNDLETLNQIKARPEAIVTLLGLSDFGILKSVINAIDHIRGKGNPEEIYKNFVNIFENHKK